MPGICKHKLHGLFMGQCQSISTSTNLFRQESELLSSATLSNETVTRHFVKGTYEITEVACNSKNSGSFARLLQLEFCSNRWHHVVKPLKDLISLEAMAQNSENILSMAHNPYQHSTYIFLQSTKLLMWI